MHGFHGRLLHIDLTRRTSSRRDLDAARLRAYLGGIGLGATLLYEWAPRGVEPFAPENPLIFASAPLVGTGLTTTAKFARSEERRVGKECSCRWAREAETT